MTARLSPFLAALVFFFVVVLWPIPTDNEHPHHNPSKLTPGESLYKSALTDTNFGLLGFHFFETANNRRNWEIRSRFAELNRKDDYFFLKEVKSNFFGRENGNVIHTTSDYGRSYLARNFVELEGDVQVVSDQGYEFRMQKMDFNSRTRLFHSDSAVNMRGPNPANPTMLLDGIGMQGSADEEQFVVQRNVSARRKLSTSEWLNIRSSRGEFFTREQRAIFFRKVRAEMPKVTILSDRFELQTKDGSETLLARGNVTLYNRQRTGRAEHVTFQPSEDQILLEGKAEIHTEDDTLRGDRILIYSEDDRIQVDSAHGVMNR